MNGCIVLPNVTFQRKRHFQVSNELAYDAAIKVKEIPRPSAVRYDTVEPARVVIVFALPGAHAERTVCLSSSVGRSNTRPKYHLLSHGASPNASNAAFFAVGRRPQ
jgi:hypothetical protein